MKTRSNRNRAKKTRKTHAQIKNHLVEVFLGILNSVKLYHWKTYSFSQHKATDELYSKLNEHIDTFMEILLGKDQSRIPDFNIRVPLVNDTSFKARILKYREFLIDMTHTFDKERDTDLLNVRDEILGDVNQFLYLLTFNK
jgi:hypothetical protein